MQAGLSELAAASGPGIEHAKYCAMYAALKAISKTPGAVSSEKLLLLLGGELRKAAGSGALALASELLDTLVKCNIITLDLSEHRFSSRGAKWYFEAKCVAPRR